MKTILCGVYGLCDPNDGQIKYIGSSKNIYLRYKCHLTHKNQENKKKCEWVEALKNKNTLPILIILQLCETIDLPELESFYIQRYQDTVYNKIKKLLNYDKYGVYSKNIISNEIKYYKNTKEMYHEGLNLSRIRDVINGKLKTYNYCIYWTGNGKEPDMSDYSRRLVNYQNKTQSLMQWSNELNLNYGTLRTDYYDKNLSFEECLKLNNRKRNDDYKKYYYNGKIYGLYELSREFNISPNTLSDRLKKGYSIEEASKPITNPRKRIDKKEK